MVFYWRITCICISYYSLKEKGIQDNLSPFIFVKLNCHVTCFYPLLEMDDITVALFSLSFANAKPKYK